MNRVLLRKAFSLGHYTRLWLLAIVMMMTISVQAQTTVSGRITSNEDGTPIPGVSVLVKGTTAGTITDSDGRYTLAINTPDPILVFSFVGYLAQEVPLEGKT